MYADNIMLTENNVNQSPNIVIEPEYYDFGFVEMLSDPRITTVTITNTGGSDLSINDISLVEYFKGNPHTNSFVEFGFVDPAPMVPSIIPPGGTQEVLVSTSQNLFTIGPALFMLRRQNL